MRTQIPAEIGSVKGLNSIQEYINGQNSIVLAQPNGLKAEYKKLVLKLASLRLQMLQTQ
ncbi:hypothetical protein [Bacillus cereus]|nr:hypothetical protein [Bacillus cereus]